MGVVHVSYLFGIAYIYLKEAKRKEIHARLRKKLRWGSLVLLTFPTEYF